jgi:pyruvate dehydrogenase E2 component (dihydrolipoamide acetyltransferase)
MHGILWFTPIVNLPESAILGVGSVEQDVRIVDGRPTEKAIMGLSLTIDHRVLDGAHGAVFLSRVKQALENPFGLIAGVPVS